jgi:hypothetical protein
MSCAFIASASAPATASGVAELGGDMGQVSPVRAFVATPPLRFRVMGGV